MQCTVVRDIIIIWYTSYLLYNNMMHGTTFTFWLIGFHSILIHFMRFVLFHNISARRGITEVHHWNLQNPHFARIRSTFSPLIFHFSYKNVVTPFRMDSVCFSWIHIAYVYCIPRFSSISIFICCCYFYMLPHLIPISKK